MLKLLGFEHYNELRVREASDKSEHISQIQENIVGYQRSLEDARKRFEEKANEAIKRTRERDSERDGEANLPTKQSKILGSDASAWTGLRASETDNPTIHLEYIYRLANKIISGHQNEPFSLDPNLLKNGSRRLLQIQRERSKPCLKGQGCLVEWEA